jgi:hypothetical protein
VVPLRTDAFNSDLKGRQEAAHRCVEDTKEKGTQKNERKRVQYDVKGPMMGKRRSVSQAAQQHDTFDMFCASCDCTSPQSAERIKSLQVSRESVCFISSNDARRVARHFSCIRV